MCIQIVISVERVRREFGAPVKFVDRNAADVKDGFVECRPSDEKSFDLKRIELDKGVQVSLVFDHQWFTIPASTALATDISVQGI